MMKIKESDIQKMTTLLQGALVICPLRYYHKIYKEQNPANVKPKYFTSKDMRWFYWLMALSQRENENDLHSWQFHKSLREYASSDDIETALRHIFAKNGWI